MTDETTLGGTYISMNAYVKLKKENELLRAGQNRQIDARTNKGDEWVNPFTKEFVSRALEKYEHYSADIDEATDNEKWRWNLVIEALERQYPMAVWWTRKEGEKTALYTCPVCEHRTITNAELHKEFYPEWYCKYCGQRLYWEE